MADDSTLAAARRALELRQKATQGELFAAPPGAAEEDADWQTPGYLSEYGQESAWTVSRRPDMAGWNTDGGFDGYGLSQENAEFFAHAANHLAPIASALLAATEEVERLRAKIERLEDALDCAGEALAEDDI